MKTEIYYRKNQVTGIWEKKIPCMSYAECNKYYADWHPIPLIDDYPAGIATWIRAIKVTSHLVAILSTPAIESRNKREGKYLVTRQYKLGKYSIRQYKRDYARIHLTECHGCKECKE